MKSYSFHINLYDVAFLGAIFLGLTFAMLLFFTKTINRSANRFLALALLIMTLWMMRVLAIDIRLENYLPNWDHLPMQFLLALGPLLYFYVLKLTSPQHKFGWKDVLHFTPLLLEQAAFALEIKESLSTNKTTFTTRTFQYLNPVLQLLIFISVIAYLYKCHKLIKNFYTRLQPVLMDRSLLEFRWLGRLLTATTLLWFSWIVCAAITLVNDDNKSTTSIYYPFYIFFAIIIIWTATAAFLRPQANLRTYTPPSVKSVPEELRAKGIWLKKAMEADRYYEDPELKIGTLAEKLGLTTHELSRIINSVLNKSFNDFINEYRVRDVVRKMKDPKYDQLTLLGIGYESGFNSQSTFTRIFKQITGQTPTEYKNKRKKEYPSYKLSTQNQLTGVISTHNAKHKGSVLKLFRNYLFNTNFMFKNYWTVAWRSLVRNKVYSLVNVLGLSLGICACLAIYLITRYEFSFDNFHSDRDRIFCVDAVYNDGHLNSVPGPMPAAMRNEMTGLESVAAFQTYTAGISIPEGPQGKPKNFEDAGAIAIVEPQYFEIFRYKWLSGHAATSLSTPHSVVLTAERARQYFGDVDHDKIIGRTIYYNDSLMVTVTGIVADWEGNSDFNFKQWISYATIRVSFLKKQITLDAWNTINRSSQVIIKLAKGVSPSQIDNQFVAFAKRHQGPPGFGARLRPISGIHFHEEYGGFSRKASLSVLYTLIAVAGFILLLAIVNFVNLSTAQSMQRAREIGVRKVLGGSRWGIAVQFFMETLVITVAAVTIAALMVQPVFNMFADLIPAGVHFRLDGATLLFLLLVVGATTVSAGFYPAKVLAKYQPTQTLKGSTSVSGGKGTLRKGLIVFQFTISLLFIIASFVMGSQLRYVLRADLGFKSDAIITLSPPQVSRPDTRVFQSDSKSQPAVLESGKLGVLIDKLRQLPGVEQVIKQGRPPIGQMHSGFGGGALKGNEEKTIDISLHHGDANYVPFYGMKLLAGRNLLAGDSTRELLISESCAHAFGFGDVSKAIGRDIVVGPDESYPVAGVLADFYESSFHKATWPVVIKHNPARERTVAIKIAAKGMQAGEVKALIERIEKEWKTVFNSVPFGYSFLDETIAEMYANDLRTERLTNLAMGVTVFISCLGLLGLAIFSAEKRTREIGIRKILGAGVLDILGMLCKEIIVLIVLALLIASPLAWYLMHSWLQGFAYRTVLNVWMFFSAGGAAIALALLAVGFQVTKAAMSNPVKSLRTE